ncbi:MAG: AbrB/MazE/SpoVT family DNA-binding domain-containing protein [Actinobacteria bacterium]|nr:AbrB/MazE/SpoVT family DNA-binding domain-containing protein [Actinomycetota bacterium]
MIARIVKIGNSQGIRIPKILLEQSGLHDEVELEVQKDQLIIKPKRSFREGWEDAFRMMAKKGDDQLLDGENLDNQSSWDANEWE